MIKPLGARVLLKGVETHKQTAGGIILPEEKETGVSEVIEVGAEVKYVKKGDRVLIQKFNSATQYDDGTQKHLIVDEKEIVATL